ncbi:MAG: DGQHR domain-containing protein, partial [Thermodesulfobacteriota bacterium]
MADEAVDDEGAARIDARSVKLELKPLLIDHAEIAKAYRKRKSRFNYSRVHSHDVAAFKEKGWSEVKAGKRYSQMKREKPLSQLLEDRLWSLCKEMGYPVLNGDHFRVAYKRDDDSIGSKQIDVFSKDDDTLIVIECKTRETRGRKSLQKDLHETAALQKAIASAARAHFSDFDPKILWIYATENIIWSEPDIQRASASNIRIITENELQYFEAYISHVGTAGRYQFLAEFLSGQEIRGLNGIKVPATRGKLGPDTFYSFTITARHLLKIAFVNHHALNHPEGRPAYQRMVDKKRLAGIGSFIKTGGYFPTNILINFVERCQFEPAALEEDGSPYRFGRLILPNKFKSAWVIDGQHRLFGFTNLPDEFLDKPLFVLAFEKMDTAREAELFITINH